MSDSAPPGKRAQAKRNTILGLAVVFGLMIAAVAFERLYVEPRRAEFKRLNEQVIDLERQGKYAEAVSLALRSLELRKAITIIDDSYVATGLDNLGALYRSMGEYDRARPYLERALSIREQAQSLDQSVLAKSLNNLGQLHQETGEYTTALSYMERALTIHQKTRGPEHPETAVSLNNLGVLHQTIGDYATAKHYLESALAINEKVLGPDDSETANMQRNLGMLYQSMGDYSTAESYLQRALDVAERTLGPAHPDLAFSLNHLGNLYLMMHRYETTLPYFERALAIREQELGNEHYYTAVSLNNLGMLHLTMGDYASADFYLERALPMKARVLGPTHPGTAMSLNNLGILYQLTGDYPAAESYYARAIVILAPSGTPIELASAESNYCYLLADLGRQSEAILFGKRAVNTLQGIRARMSSLDDRLQQTFLKRVEFHYRNVADLLIDAGRLPEAQQVLRMLKEHEYFEFVRSSPGDDPRVTLISFNSFEAEWNERLERATAKLQELATKSEAVGWSESELSDSDTTALKNRIASAQQSYIELLEEVRTDFAELQNDRAARYADLLDEELSAERRARFTSLAPGTVLVHLFGVEESFHALLTTEGGVVHRQTAVNRADLNSTIQAFRNALSDPNSDPRGPAAMLHSWLIEPIAPDLQEAGATTLMLYLDGPLRYIPVAALYDGERYLVEQFALVIFTEAAGLTTVQQPVAEWQLAGLGSSRAYEGFSALPAVRRELEGIVRQNETDTDGVLPGVIYLDDAFTREAVDTIFADQYPVIHIASHFAFRSGTDINSYLLLGDGSRLTLADVRTSGFDLAAVQLVTLSACETAVGDLSADGREVEGLGTLFQRQGAQAVLATLWPVADASTGVFMQSLYGQRVEKNLSKAEALRQVQLGFINGSFSRVSTSIGERAKTVTPWPDSVDPEITSSETGLTGWAHPYYWAPFILMGNWL